MASVILQMSTRMMWVKFSERGRGYQHQEQTLYRGRVGRNFWSASQNLTPLSGSTVVSLLQSRGTWAAIMKPVRYPLAFLRAVPNPSRCDGLYRTFELCPITSSGKNQFVINPPRTVISNKQGVRSSVVPRGFHSARVISTSRNTSNPNKNTPKGEPYRDK